MAFRISWAWTPVAFACVTVTLLAIEAAPAAAQSQGQITKEQAVQLVFNRFDTNKDGGVSKDEFLDPKPRHVGNASADDLARAKKIWAQQFDYLDTDKNGKLSEAEHQAAGKRSFAHMDANKDNEITLAELTAAAK